MPAQLRKVRSMILGLGLFAGVYVATLLVVQRWLLFPRPSLDGALPRPRDAVQVWLDAAGGRVEAWYLPPSGASSRPSPVLLFFHGNGELIDFWPDDFGEPRSWGMGVLLVEYPGYFECDECEVLACSRVGQRGDSPR